jgi:hypothetical protein
MCIKRRFTIYQTPSHIATQVSQRARRIVLSQGYIAWKVQNQVGRSRTFYWHPEIDIITFPENPYDDEAEQAMVLKLLKQIRVTYLQSFRGQYQEVAAVAERVAIPTTFCRREEWAQPWDWVNCDIGCFQSLKDLIVFVDEKKERAEVAHLRQQGLVTSPPGIWYVPGDIEAVYRDNVTSRLKAQGRILPDHEVPVPSVRIVGGIDMLLTDQRLNIKLRVNPCEYLGM